MKTLTHGELFAGISGFGLGFDRAGMSTVWHVENDKKCQTVLRHHYPDSLILDDVRDCGKHNLPYVDVISFGTPCQDLSVAGKREGLKGERSGLFFEAIRIVGELKPAFAVWENVPGAFSSNSGRDFATVLAAFQECGARDIAWRVLDAQYFGVAQRRRRVFVVADFRAERAAEILFERESSPWNSAPSREAGTRITTSLTGGPGSSSAGNPDDNRAQGNFIVPAVYSATGNSWYSEGQRPPAARDWRDSSGLVVGPLQTHHTPKGHGCAGVNDQYVAAGHLVISETGQGFFNDGIAPLRAEGENRPSRPSTIVFEPRFVRNDRGKPVVICDHCGFETEIPDEWDECPCCLRPASWRTIVPPLKAQSGKTGKGDAAPLIVFDWQAGSGGKDESFRGKSRSYIVRKKEYAQIRKNAHDAVAGQFGVRRLMPIEAERLQGFPDNFTAIDGMSDSARYRMLGNAVAVPVAQWLGRRILKQGKAE